MTRALTISETEQRMIADLVEYARQHPFDLETLRTAMTAKGSKLLEWKLRLNPFTIDLPVGFRVTYTHEHQPIGLCHHLSVSIDVPQFVPNAYAILMLCEQFGIKRESIVRTWPEYYVKDRIAVNIVAKYGA